MQTAARQSRPLARAGPGSIRDCIRASVHSSRMIEITREGEIAVLCLSHGKASALDLELCEALERAAAQAEESDARAIVLTGRGPIFSAGVDLKRIVVGGPSYVAEFLPALDAALLA